MGTMNAVRLWTVEDYHKMGEVGLLAPDERVELIEGVIIPMSPVGPRHVTIVDRLTEVLVVAFRGQYRISIQNPIILSDDSEPEPDASVSKRLADDEIARTPVAEDVYLVVEVSDSTLLKDQTVKVPLYARVTIPEMWVIDADANVIEQYTDPHDGVYQTMREWRRGEQIPTTLGATLDTNEILLANL